MILSPNCNPHGQTKKVNKWIRAKLKYQTSKASKNKGQSTSKPKGAAQWGVKY